MQDLLLGHLGIVGPVARAAARATSGNITATDITGDASLGSASGNLRAEHIGGVLAVALDETVTDDDVLDAM